MSSLSKDPASLHNPYFQQNPSKKDVWTLINETAAAAQEELGAPVTNLGQGFYSYNPPDFAIDAVSHSLAKPQFNQYASPRGNPNLLKSLAEKYSKDFGRTVDTSQLVVTTGANEGMFSVFFGFLTPGDEAIVFEPFFDQYIPNVEMTGAKVKFVSIKPPKDFGSRNTTGDDWEVDWEALENAITPKTKIIVINTPHNPIGKIFNEDELVRIGKLAIKHNIILLSDEVYENLYYTSFPRPAALPVLPELADRTLTVGSAGKSFAATGWRIGWIQGPSELIQYVVSAHTRICFSAPAPLQQAVSEALSLSGDNGYFETTRKDYSKKYELFSAVFDDLGLPYTVAQGGYFLLVNFEKLKIAEDYKYPADIEGRGTNDYKLVYWLIKEIGVVGIPPTEFLQPGTRKGSPLENSVRFAVCKDDEILQDAAKKLRKLKNFL
ncbi:PLP-dependent transferase [Metschnikowia bicuspidata var. bicuspidata NRRL YB-4993]|uniref:PLP-dependent transferase n=1 Tax=Metschnikowia bicuspidata var. bicuspidata NRRL YB-4993 TaxID=869754 RepID=A0A1A0H6W8_9ASCO|nr:PLP-dependent transferase [Metschnikowia bicuspidata var. bicuspidata NRRL YB-4993]OBA19776.1 PLP-dependent transferase [Metschnikowia bicuspidata var. bicuspidata NRRL YB-4993]